MNTATQFTPGKLKPVLKCIVDNTVEEAIPVKLRTAADEEIEGVCFNYSRSEIPHLQCVKTEKRYPLGDIELLKVG